MKMKTSITEMIEQQTRMVVEDGDKVDNKLRDVIGTIVGELGAASTQTKELQEDQEYETWRENQRNSGAKFDDAVDDDHDHDGHMDDHQPLGGPDSSEDHYHAEVDGHTHKLIKGVFDQIKHIRNIHMTKGRLKVWDDMLDQVDKGKSDVSEMRDNMKKELIAVGFATEKELEDMDDDDIHDLYRQSRADYDIGQDPEIKSLSEKYEHGDISDEQALQQLENKDMGGLLEDGLDAAFD